MTNHFEIKIPKYLIKDKVPNRDTLDYVFTLMVYYWYSNHKLVISIQHLLELGEYLDWENPRLKQYLTAACENNHENMYGEKGDLKYEESPTLNRYANENS